MNWLEQFAVSIILGVLHQVIKNPKHAAELQAVLLGLADNIYATYGKTPPIQ